MGAHLAWQRPTFLNEMVREAQARARRHRPRQKQLVNSISWVQKPDARNETPNVPDRNGNDPADLDGDKNGARHYRVDSPVAAAQKVPTARRIASEAIRCQRLTQRGVVRK
jgi:hypothetical protein